MNAADAAKQIAAILAQLAEGTDVEQVCADAQDMAKTARKAAQAESLTEDLLDCNEQRRGEGRPEWTMAEYVAFGDGEIEW